MEPAETNRATQSVQPFRHVIFAWSTSSCYIVMPRSRIVSSAQTIIRYYRDDERWWGPLASTAEKAWQMQNGNGRIT